MNTPYKTVKVLDVTLRDGSYLIDFQFSDRDTAFICKALESAGIDWIEIGHGVGLGGSLKGYGRAAASDEEYIRAAAENIERANWGCFFIPGIGTMEDMQMAASYKMPFIRIGTNITEIEKAVPFIEKAKSLGMFVAYNGMKSYAVKPEEFARAALGAQKAGADMVCLVDSAGGFYPSDVEAYFKACQDLSDIKIGYHGHDNLSLVMANTLKAIECGAFMVDTSVQGMGRSAGNAITEVLIAILKQKGAADKVDLNALIDLGQNVISPMIFSQGSDPLAIVSGYARFHSSFTSKVQNYAQRFQLDVRDLIVKLCEHDQVNAPDDLLEELSKELSHNRIAGNKSFSLTFKKGPENAVHRLETLIKELKIRAVKYSRYSAINITVNPEQTENLVVSGNLYTTGSQIMAAVCVKNREALETVAAQIDGQVDVALVDHDDAGIAQVELLNQLLKETVCLNYSDSRAWAWAVEEQTVAAFNGLIKDKNVLIYGQNEKALMLRNNLQRRGANVVMLPQTIESGQANGQSEAAFIPDACIVWHCDETTARKLVEQVNEKSFVLDAGLGSMTSETIRQLLQKNASLVRVNMWPVLSGILLALHETHLVKEELRGKATYDDITVISGGLVGRKGDIVVDNYKQPSHILGVADGEGRVLTEYDSDTDSKVQRLMGLIYNKLVYQS